MKLENYILKIQTHLLETHLKVLNWFEASNEVKRYKPEDEGWTICEILEHITLTNHFLLSLIDKGMEKALRNTKGLSLEEELKLSQNSNEYVKKYSAIITKNTKEIIINDINKSENSEYKKLPVSIKELPESRVVENFLYEKLYDKVTQLKKQKSLEDTEVIVESDKLRDLNPNHIIQIKMKIIEQGMEWHKIEDGEGNTVSKLTVE